MWKMLTFFQKRNSMSFVIRRPCPTDGPCILAIKIQIGKHNKEFWLLTIFTGRILFSTRFPLLFTIYLTSHSNIIVQKKSSEPDQNHNFHDVIGWGHAQTIFGDFPYTEKHVQSNFTFHDTTLLRNTQHYRVETIWSSTDFERDSRKPPRLPTSIHPLPLVKWRTLTSSIVYLEAWHWIALLPISFYEIPTLLSGSF